MAEPQYGNSMSMGFLSEDWIVACIPQTAKKLIEQMRRTVVPEDGFTLVFRMYKTDEDGIYSCTGAWKCSGNLVGGQNDDQ